jgi:hypothetical protein
LSSEGLEAILKEFLLYLVADLDNLQASQKAKHTAGGNLPYFLNLNYFL